jgi:hypothetical protein
MSYHGEQKRKNKGRKVTILIELALLVSELAVITVIIVSLLIF